MAAWSRLWCLPVVLAFGCEAAPTPVEPVALDELARTAEAELGAIAEILETQRPASFLHGRLNSTATETGLGRAAPQQPTPDDVSTCFRLPATSYGLQIVDIHSDVLPVARQHAAEVTPGQRWMPTPDQVLGRLEVHATLRGPLPILAKLIDDQARCPRLVAVRSAKVTGDTVEILADAYYERVVPPPYIDLQEPKVADRLRAAGWNPEDPKLRADPAYRRLVDAVDAIHKQLTPARDVLATGASLQRWLVRLEELASIRRKAATVRGAVLLGLAKPG